MSSTLLALIIGWMVAITGYRMPEHFPSVQFEPHSFFVEKVCGGNECDAQGWYNDKGIIYIDERHYLVLSENSYPVKPDQSHAEAVSLLGHESVHFLQDLSGKFTKKSCENFLSREEEAFTAQRIGMIPYLKFLIPRPTVRRSYRCPQE
ncbi:MAG: hypothetical protein NTZ13_04090 [Candidatus Parcubacteria bacterium]|nr:hypothetical protein [Candidatus Parcubacteria bacterium]